MLTQSNRMLEITTPLGKNALLLIGLQGREAISELFAFEVDLLAPKEQSIAFDKILGQPVTVRVRLGQNAERLFHGIVRRFEESERDEVFTHYSAEIVPQFWLSTKRVRSRIFQHLTVPEILTKVLQGLEVSFQIRGAYQPRDYCVQYRESDFAFASRLMEEEGIYYFFQHAVDKHTLVVSDTPLLHPEVPGPTTAIFDEVRGGNRPDVRVTAWRKSQELRSGKYTLWDHCFELPDKNFESQATSTQEVKVGQVGHKLRVGGNEHLEIYDYPGAFAQRFDGVGPGGDNRPAELPKIFDDGKRTVKLRLEQEASAGLEIRGDSNCGQFTAGHQFNLSRHRNADGPYLLTRVEHRARLSGNYRSGEDATFEYQNSFVAIPEALPYRPPLVTTEPFIAGLQTATVVGPAGQEIFCDKYGRVKVQFRWDREGKKNADSSCWVRVAQFWAGKGWGAFFWPRIGHEVVVAFEEGDPDQPLIVGSVYNAENMPPFVLPQKNMLAGIKSASVRGNAGQNYNGILFDDEKGREHLAIHSERHLTFNSELDKLFQSGRHKSERVSSVSLLTVGTLPGGGGSGGGPDGDPYYDWTPPGATGLGGLNALMVYGENLAFATGLNHQAAFGSNVQVCINPFSLLGCTAPPAISSALLGGGIGGNLQLTLGSSVNFVTGRIFDINLGPRRFVVDAGDKNHVLTIACCRLIGTAYILWTALHGLLGIIDSPTGQNASRSVTAGVMQILIDVLLTALLKTEIIYRNNELIDDIATATKAGDTKQVKDLQAEFADLPKTELDLFSLGTGLPLLLAGVVPVAADFVTATRSKSDANAPNDNQPNQPSGGQGSSGSGS